MLLASGSTCQPGTYRSRDLRSSPTPTRTSYGSMLREIATLKRSSYASTSDILERFQFLRKRITTIDTMSDFALSHLLINALEGFDDTLYNKVRLEEAPKLPSILNHLAKPQARELESNTTSVTMLAATHTQNTSTQRSNSPRRRKYCEYMHKGPCWMLFPESVPTTMSGRKKVLRAICRSIALPRPRQ